MANEKVKVRGVVDLIFCCGCDARSTGRSGQNMKIRQRRQLAAVLRQVERFVGGYFSNYRHPPVRPPSSLALRARARNIDVCETSGAAVTDPVFVANLLIPILNLNLQMRPNLKIAGTHLTCPAEFLITKMTNKGEES